MTPLGTSRLDNGSIHFVLQQIMSDLFSSSCWFKGAARTVRGIYWTGFSADQLQHEVSDHTVKNWHFKGNLIEPN